MANMTGGTAGTMATWTKEVWSDIATVTYRPKVILAPLLDRRWEPELGVGAGDTVNIPAFSQNSGAVARSTFGTAAGLSSELIATTESQVQLIVNLMAIYGFSMPKEGKVQAAPSYYKRLIEGVGESLALFMDARIGSDNTNGFDGFSTVVGTDNVDITEDNFITCMTNLNNANAPLEGRAFVVSPASFGSIVTIESLRNQLYGRSTGNVDVNKGQGPIGGPIYTFMLYMSNNLEAGTSGKKNAAFQKEAIALCVQQGVDIDHEYSVVDGMIEYVAGSIIFGLKEVKDSFGNEVDGK